MDPGCAFPRELWAFVRQQSDASSRVGLCRREARSNPLQGSKRSSSWNLSVARSSRLHVHDTLSVPCSPSSRAAMLVQIGFFGLVGSATWVPESVHAQSFIDSCVVQVGLGETYHYWATTGSLVLPVSVSWSENRYEIGAFRFTTQQLLPWPGTHEERHMASPYWGTSLSRRWHLFDRGSVQDMSASDCR
jgi:hypothetical protein